MANLDSDARGVYPIAPTPFHENGEIDWGSLDRLVDFYAETGCSGITVLGLMGEAQKLDAAEAAAVVRRVTARAGKLPVVVGVSAPGFAAMRALARLSMDAGAAGVMLAPAPSLRTDDQVVSYFDGAIAALGEDIPVVLQDYPQVFNVVMTPRVLATIVSAHPSIVIVKHEDWPGLEKISELRRMMSDGRMRKTSILCGNGGLFLDLELQRGADGAMTGYAFPEMLVKLCNLAAANRFDEGRALFATHLPLIRYEHQPSVGLAVRKYVLTTRGIISHDAQRPPFSKLTDSARKEVDSLLELIA